MKIIWSKEHFIIERADDTPEDPTFDKPSTDDPLNDPKYMADIKEKLEAQFGEDNVNTDFVNKFVAALVASSSDKPTMSEILNGMKPTKLEGTIQTSTDGKKATVNVPERLGKVELTFTDDADMNEEGALSAKEKAGRCLKAANEVAAADSLAGTPDGSLSSALASPDNTEAKEITTQQATNDANGLRTADSANDVIQTLQTAADRRQKWENFTKALSAADETTQPSKTMTSRVWSFWVGHTSAEPVLIKNALGCLFGIGNVPGEKQLGTTTKVVDGPLTNITGESPLSQTSVGDALKNSGWPTNNRPDSLAVVDNIASALDKTDNDQKGAFAKALGFKDVAGLNDAINKTKGTDEYKMYTTCKSLGMDNPIIGKTISKAFLENGNLTDFGTEVAGKFDITPENFKNSLNEYKTFMESNDASKAVGEVAAPSPKLDAAIIKDGIQASTENGAITTDQAAIAEQALELEKQKQAAAAEYTLAKLLGEINADTYEKIAGEAVQTMRNSLDNGAIDLEASSAKIKDLMKSPQFENAVGQLFKLERNATTGDLTIRPDTSEATTAAAADQMLGVASGVCGEFANGNLSKGHTDFVQADLLNSMLKNCDGVDFSEGMTDTNRNNLTGEKFTTAKQMEDDKRAGLLKFIQEGQEQADPGAKAALQEVYGGPDGKPAQKPVFEFPSGSDNKFTLDQMVKKGFPDTPDEYYGTEAKAVREKLTGVNGPLGKRIEALTLSENSLSFISGPKDAETGQHAKSFIDPKTGEFGFDFKNGPGADYDGNSVLDLAGFKALKTNDDIETSTMAMAREAVAKGIKDSLLATKKEVCGGILDSFNMLNIFNVATFGLLDLQGVRDSWVNNKGGKAAFWTFFSIFVGIPFRLLGSAGRLVWQPIGLATGFDITDYERSPELKKLGSGKFSERSIESLAGGADREGTIKKLKAAAATTAEQPGMTALGKQYDLDNLAAVQQKLTAVRDGQRSDGNGAARKVVAENLDESNMGKQNSAALKSIETNRPGVVARTDTQIATITDYKDAIKAYSDAAAPPAADSEELASLKDAVDKAKTKLDDEVFKKDSDGNLISDPAIDAAEDWHDAAENEEIEDIMEKARRRERFRGICAIILGILGGLHVRHHICEETLSAARKSGCFMYPYDSPSNSSFVSALQSPSAKPPPPPKPSEISGVPVTIQKIPWLTCDPTYYNWGLSKYESGPGSCGDDTSTQYCTDNCLTFEANSYASGSYNYNTNPVGYFAGLDAYNVQPNGGGGGTSTSNVPITIIKNYPGAPIGATCKNLTSMQEYGMMLWDCNSAYVKNTPLMTPLPDSKGSVCANNQCQFNTKLINQTQQSYNVKIQQGAGCFGYGEKGLDLQYVKENFTTPWCGFKDNLAQQGDLPQCVISPTVNSRVFSNTDCNTNSPASYMWETSKANAKTKFCYPITPPTKLTPTTAASYNVEWTPTASPSATSASVDILCLGNMGAQIATNTSPSLNPFSPRLNESQSTWLERVKPTTLSDVFSLSSTNNPVGVSVAPTFGTYSAVQNQTAAGPCVEWSNLGTTFPVPINLPRTELGAGQKQPPFGGGAYCKTALGGTTPLTSFCPPTYEACGSGALGIITTCKPRPSIYCGLMQTDSGWEYPTFVPDGYALVGQTIVPSIGILSMFGSFACSVLDLGGALPGGGVCGGFGLGGDGCGPLGKIFSHLGKFGDILCWIWKHWWTFLIIVILLLTWDIWWPFVEGILKGLFGFAEEGEDEGGGEADGGEGGDRKVEVVVKTQQSAASLAERCAGGDKQACRDDKYQKRRSRAHAVGAKAHAVIRNPAKLFRSSKAKGESTTPVKSDDSLPQKPAATKGGKAFNLGDAIHQAFNM